MLTFKITILVTFNFLLVKITVKSMVVPKERFDIYVSQYLTYVYIVMCQVQPALVKRVQCMVRS